MDTTRGTSCIRLVATRLPRYRRLLHGPSQYQESHTRTDAEYICTRKSTVKLDHAYELYARTRQLLSRKKVGTDVARGAISLRAPYALSGTDAALDPRRRRLRQLRQCSGSNPVQLTTRVRRFSTSPLLVTTGVRRFFYYAMPGAEIR
eukprot:2737768-Rhodomonas_salina.2